MTSIKLWQRFSKQWGGVLFPEAHRINETRLQKEHLSVTMTTASQGGRGVLSRSSALILCLLELRFWRTDSSPAIAIANSCCSLLCVILLFCVLTETKAFVQELITTLRSSQSKARRSFLYF